MAEKIWVCCYSPPNQRGPRTGELLRCALNVPNHETAKMILADTADRGARPQDLRPGADAGTVVATGEVEDIPNGQAFAIVRILWGSNIGIVA
jgi:hypothetical protein